MDSSFWPWRKTTEHAIQTHFISSPEKIQNNAVCRQDSFGCFWDSQRVYMTEFLEAGNTVNSAQYIETIKKTYGGGCVEFGGQHCGFWWCLTMQVRTLLAQRLKLWRRWSFEVLSHLPYSAKRFPFLSSPQGGSQGDSFHLRWWSEASCGVMNQTKNSWILHWRHA